MCYFRKGTLWHENGAGLHVKAHPAPAVWPCWLCAGPCNHSDPTQLLWYLDVISLQYTVCGVTCEEHEEGTHQMFKAAVIKNLSVWLRRTKPGEGTRPSLCLWSVLGSLKERQLWEMLCMLLRDCAYYLSAVLSIIRHVFVPTDMFLKWNETGRGDKDLKSLCESNLKVPLRRLSFCSLKSGGVTGGWAQTTAETLTGAVMGFFPCLCF